MKKFYEKVCKLEELIALILVAGIAVLVFVSALMRTIGHPLNWALINSMSRQQRFTLKVELCITWG